MPTSVRHLLCIVLASTLLVAGCAADEAPEEAEPPSVEPEADDDGTEEPVGEDQGPPRAQIATVLTRSGFAAVFGENQQRGIELAVKHLAEEGIAELEIVAAEDAGDSPTTALNAYRRAAGQEPVAIFGPIVGTMVMAMRDDIDSNEIPFIVTASTPPITLNDNQWVYRNHPHGGMLATVMSQYALDELGIERPAILADNTDFGQGTAQIEVAEAEERGIDIVANESVAPDAIDLTGQVSRILSAEADGVFVELLTGSPLAEAIRALRGAGYEGHIFAAPGLPSPSTLELLSDQDVEGAYTPVLGLDRDDERVQAYVEAFQTEYGEEPDVFSAVMYDSVRFLGEVIAAGASTTQEIKDGLDTMTYEGLTTVMQADAEGNLSHRVDVLEFDDQKTPSTVATFELDFTARGGDDGG